MQQYNTPFLSMKFVDESCIEYDQIGNLVFSHFVLFDFIFCVCEIIFCLLEDLCFSFLLFLYLSVNGSIMNRQPVSVGKIPPAIVKVVRSIYFLSFN